MLYTVGEMAKELGVTASTLRYYDREGLLPFVERSSGGVRMFTEKDYEWLKVIECLKRSGLSIKEIKSYMDMVERGDDSLAERLALFQNRRSAIRKQFEELQETLDLLDYKCWFYEEAIRLGSDKPLQDLTPEDVPEQYRAAKEKIILKHPSRS